MELELRQYAVLLWRWLWLIVLGAILAGGTALVVSLNQTPIYETATTLLISQGDNPALNTYYDLFASQRLASTYTELLTKPVILEAAAARLGLETISAGDISVSVVRDTQLIELRVKNSDPQLAAAIANTIPTVFIERNDTIQRGRFAESKEALTRELSQLQADIEVTQARITAIGTPATAAEEAELARLQTALAQYRSGYASLLSSYEATRVAEAKAMETIIVFQEAAVPTEPVLPRTSTNVLLAAAVGTALTIGIAFLMEYLDDTLKSPEDVARALELSTLATIMRTRARKRAGKAEAEMLLATAQKSKSPVSEAFRTLRTNIQFSSVDRPARRLLVTSAGPTEGKSFVAANLAAVIAQAGQSVVLMDCDLRRPTLQKIFKLSNEGGLTNSLLADSNPGADEYLLPTSVENLRVLTSGPLPPNPSELLGSQRMSRLIEHLEQQADVLIFDSPPILAVTDAAVLSRQADGVLVVIEAGETRQGEARRALEELSKVSAPILGVVLNKVPGRRGGYGYYYYHRYYGDSRKQ